MPPRSHNNNNRPRGGGKNEKSKRQNEITLKIGKKFSWKFLEFDIVEPLQDKRRRRKKIVSFSKE